MASRKSASVEDTIDRVGVSWRRNPTTCVVEMRPPAWKWRLHFGSYDTEVEAMIARDYGALLRVSAGEDDTSAGGFNVDEHPCIFQFDESHVIFNSMEIFTVRCDEFKRLLTLYPPQPKEKSGANSPQQPKEKSGANSPYKEFCKEARNDIAIAIEEFRRRYPHKFVNCRPATEATKDLQKVNGSLDGGTHLTPPSLNFEVGSSQSSQSSMMATDLLKVDGSLDLLKVDGSLGLLKVDKFLDLLMVDGSLDDGTHLTPPSSNFEVGSSQSSQSSMMAENKQNGGAWELEQFMPGAHKYHKKNSSSGFPSFNHLSSSPDGQSRHVIRGFHGDSMYDGRSQETSPRIKENSKFEIKDLKSLLQVQLENSNPLEPYHDGLKMQDDGVSMAGFSSIFFSPKNLSPFCSYESNKTQLASFKSGVTSNSRMSPTSITYSGAPGSLSAGTSVEDETGLSSNNRSNCRQEMAQIEEHFAEGEGDPQFPNFLSHVDMGEVADPWLCDLQFQNENQPPMDIDEMVNVMDIPSMIIPRESDDVPESNRAPNHMLSTAPNSTSQMERIMSEVEVSHKVVSKVALNKVISKAASNKVMSKAEMVEKRFKNSTLLAKSSSALSAQIETLIAARLETERVKLDLAEQQRNTVKIANLKTAKDEGVISHEKYIEDVKTLLNL